MLRIHYIQEKTNNIKLVIPHTNWHLHHVKRYWTTLVYGTVWKVSHIWYTLYEQTN
jgi:hypothetical protein